MSLNKGSIRGLRVLTRRRKLTVATLRQRALFSKHGHHQTAARAARRAARNAHAR